MVLREEPGEPIGDVLMSHSDFISGRTQAWPYGTRKEVEVFHVDYSNRPAVMMCAKVGDEGYVLIGGFPEGLKEGNRGEIVFTKGGPTGGYWKWHSLPIEEPIGKVVCR